MTPIKSPKKLIEVALPLDAINEASARENYIYKGNPSAIHKWWAQRPLAAARAIIFAQLVNDPGFQQGGGFRYGKNKKEASFERKRLFKIIEELVQWENINNKEVIEAARVEIQRSWREVCELNIDHPQAAELFNPDKMPGLYDPFAGGGTIPLEAQRLGLDALASDLNPVSVLLNKAMIEIPPRFTDHPPVHPNTKNASKMRTWDGAQGIAEDVCRYGAWIRTETEKRIGHLYPCVEISEQIAKDRPDLKPFIGQKFPILAWLWTRTVRSPNPAFSEVHVPLSSTFILSSKTGKEMFAQPIVQNNTYHFAVKPGVPPSNFRDGTKVKGKGSEFRCLMSNTPIDGAYIKSEAQKGRMKQRLMAVVVEIHRKRMYLSPTEEMESLARSTKPSWKPDLEFAHNSRHLTPWAYGLSNFGSLYTDRQLEALSTIGSLISEVRNMVEKDALLAGFSADGRGLEEKGDSAKAYSEAISVYLTFALNKTAEYNNSLVTWYAREDRPKGVFTRQALPMIWDFSEPNILGSIGGSFIKSVEIVAESLSAFFAKNSGLAIQSDAAKDSPFKNVFISTDPPYYDNVPYADLSDFFYVWLRKILRSVFPQILATISVPKSEELVADPFRQGGKEAAEKFFLDGMTKAMTRIANQSHVAAPLTIYYAFKQSDTKQTETSSTGWVTFLEAVHRAGLALTGTWPIRTEREGRSRGIESNALASSVVLVCRKRPDDAPTTSRREFMRELNKALPEALDEMTQGTGEDQSPVAPVDLSQAIIGPGMAIFSKYKAVLEANGQPMSVKTALQLINRFLAEDDFDADTQFCLRWFEQHGWDEGAFGEADVLARAKATSVSGLIEAGVVQSASGKTRLLRPAEYPADWDPRTDKRLPVWEALHQLIRALKQEGESAAGKVLAAVRDRGESIRQLAYRLYTMCERRGWASDAGAYNELVTSWGAIETEASKVPEVPVQGRLPGVD